MNFTVVMGVRDRGKGTEIVKGVKKEVGRAEGGSPLLDNS